jgi:uncharacterized protein
MGEGRNLGDVVIRVRVVPGASRTRIAGWQADGALAARVAVPPEAGRANEALVELLAGVLGISRRDIEISAGRTSRLKTVRIRGLTDEELRARVAAH